MELPKSFSHMLQHLLPNEWQELCNAITGTEPSVSVRVNRRRRVKVPKDAALVPWCHDAFYCDNRPAFTFDPLFHSGLYYVQDASSMFLHHVLSILIHEPVRYLDLCAAPGGKTTTALDALPAGSLVVANEIVSSRARVLCDNVIKWGNSHTVVTNNTPAHLGALRHFFDIIATDVPCSGEGMMRKDAEAVAQWTPALVEECSARQRTIIDDVWHALRPGGLLIYSTCTYNRRENEQIIEYLISEYEAEPVPVPISDDWNIMPAIDAQFPAYRFMPHRTRGEGLFMAVVRKPGNEAHAIITVNGKSGKGTKPAQVPLDVKQWLSSQENYSYTTNGDEICATPLAWCQETTMLNQKLNVLHSGIKLGITKGKSIVPAHVLALSDALNDDAFPACEVDYRTAMAYLRGESITIDAPRGYVRLTYHKASLGWVNNLGNRANNLYPKSLRILSTHLPDSPPMVID